MIDYEKTLAWRSGDVRHSYTAKDTILYALGLGVGADPMDPAQLRLTYEKGLQTLPTMAAVLASPGFWMKERTELGIDYLKLVHGEQSVTVHEPLSAAATLVGRSRVLRIVDKGEGKGALLYVEKSLHDAQTDRLMAVAEQVLFLRGDGGFSKGAGASAAAGSAGTAVEPLPATPARAPDAVWDWPIRRDAALLYRLSGDLNPLHVDPAVAARAGFDRPILHGLATYGMAGYGLVHLVCQDDPRRLVSMRARLTAPVFPGETLRLQVWKLTDQACAFRALVVERDMQVLGHGLATLKEANA